MKKKKNKQLEQLVFIEDGVSSINNNLMDVNEKLWFTNIILIVGFVVLFLFGLFSLRVFVDFNEVEDVAFVVEGRLDLMGADSFVVNGVLYEGGCSSDLDLLSINDSVIITDCKGFLCCDTYHLVKLD